MKWRKGLVGSLFKKGDKEDPGNYRVITHLSVVGKLFCKILNDCFEELLVKSYIIDIWKLLYGFGPGPLQHRN